MPQFQYSRWQQHIISKALQSRRVLVLAGSRQCGKTTLARAIATDATVYRTLDDTTLLAAALSDPHGFVRHGDNLMIIDEVQKAPVLLPAIKQDVDVQQLPGRFLLTGSANIQALPGVSESLAGRIRKIRLRPLAQGEIKGVPAHFLPNAFAETFLPNSSLQATGEYSLKDRYILLALRGGYPEVVRQSEEREARRWLNDYLDALLDRDLQDIINIRRRDSMVLLVEVLAAWSSKFMDIAGIGTGLALARATIQTYINALEALYLVERVRPWTKTDYERVSKQDKLFMTDTGLMAAVLRWRFDKVRLDGEKNGKLLETFVFTQLAAQRDAQEEDYQLYHYRDREQREVDFIVENEDGDLLGIEVKAGSAVSKDSFKHLYWFRDHMAKSKRFVGVVVYTGEHVVPFGAGMWAVPISVLWGA
ncbi:ATP-binding protein [Thiothrix subterranea]|uniref:ATP-binding protein n=1 Tax=Thiothrix subterranea TaxID=2735563 RepID=UPI00192B76D3|nr:ATP-binding protein [Thiothrix subterranea]QQZ29578.1 ATP-binding protein [Thiothrix subterranea]